MDDAIEPDTKDWTWVLERPCPECGFDASGVLPADVADRIDDSAPVLVAALAQPGAAVRPAPATWSVLEYGCHLRDVHRVFEERLALVLDRDDPEFANWDQDATAVDDDYAGQDPAVVSGELVAAAERVSAAYRRVEGADLGRTGIRSNGSRFTLETLAQYHLHDLVHHLHDIGWAGAAGRARATRFAYEHAGEQWGSAPASERVRDALAAFAGFLGTGARVLEIGSGSGRDALEMEELGLRVRRTDVTPTFVERLRDQGHTADLLDPLTDDLVDPAGPYDGVWANASLLHVDRDDLPVLLGRLASTVRVGGVLRLSLKQGDGAGWSTHGHVPYARHFTYWQPGALGQVLRESGWHPVEQVSGVAGQRAETWLETTAVKA